MKVFVYFNLRTQLWSVKALEGPRKGRVIAHRAIVTLKDCRFRVSEAGRQRVLREQRKNVHAGVEGSWARASRAGQGKRSVTYNPYQAPTFVERSTRAPVFTAPSAVLVDRQVYIQ